MDKQLNGINFHFEGHLEARVFDKDTGGLREYHQTPNTIVDVGLAQTILLQGSAGANVFRAGAIGTGTTAAATGDTSLVSEVDRQSVTFTQTTTTVTGDTGQYVTLHTAPTGGWDVTEYMLLNNGTAAGTGYNRVVFTAVSVPSGDQLELTYKTQAQRS